MEINAFYVKLSVPGEKAFAWRNIVIAPERNQILLTRTANVFWHEPVVYTQFLQCNYVLDLLIPDSY